jgi:hypothetical protein
MLIVAALISLKSHFVLKSDLEPDSDYLESRIRTKKTRPEN